MIHLGLTCSTYTLKEKRWEGLSGSRINQTYLQSVLMAGAAPVPLPVIADTSALSSIINSCEGLLLTGGGDISPIYYGEEYSPDLRSVSDARDICELLLFRLAMERKIPVFGICRGMQLINVALGGSLYQHLGSVPEFNIQHDQQEERRTTTHGIAIETGSIMERVFGSQAQVNSFHHQAIKDLAPGLKVTARSPDGVIEAVESIDQSGPVIMGVQWHPEELSASEPKAAALFKLFVELCEEGGRS